MSSPFCAHLSSSLVSALLEADIGHSFAVVLAQRPGFDPALAGGLD